MACIILARLDKFGPVLEYKHTYVISIVCQSSVANMTIRFSVIVAYAIFVTHAEIVH